MAVEVEVRKKLLFVNSLSSLVAQLLQITVLVWMYQYLLRHISPEDYSLLPVIAAVFAFAPLLTAILTSGIGRYAADAYARGDEGRVTEIVSTMLPMVLLASLVLGFCGGYLALNIGSIVTIAPGRELEAQVMFGLLVFSLSIRLPLAVLSVGIFIRQRFVLQNAVHIAIELFRIALLLVLLIGVGPRVVWVVVALAASQVMEATILALISRSIIHAVRFRRGSFRRPLLRELLTFGTWNFVAGVSDVIHRASDPIILNKLGTPLDVTTLHLGSIADNQLRSLAGKASHPLQPMLTAINARDEPERLRRVFLRVSRYQLWVVLGPVVPLIVFSNEVIRLYVGPAYMDAALVLVLLFASYPMMFSTNQLVKIAIAMGHMRTFALLSLMVNLINLVVTIVMVWVFGLGAIGAAASSLAARLLAQPLLYWPMMAHLLDLRLDLWFRETFIPGVAPAVASLFIGVVLANVNAAETWLGLGLYSIILLAFYVMVLWRFCLFAVDQREFSVVIAKARSIWSGGR